MSLLLYENSRNAVLTRTWFAFRVRVPRVHPLLDVAWLESGITDTETDITDQCTSSVRQK